MAPAGSTLLFQRFGLFSSFLFIFLNWGIFFSSIGTVLFESESCLYSVSSFDLDSSLYSVSSLDSVSSFDSNSSFNLDSSLAWNNFLVLKNLMKNVRYNNEFIYILIAIPKYLIKFIAVDTWIQSK